MLTKVLTTLSVFLLIHTAAAIPDYITDYKSIIASSTYTVDNYDFSVVNVVDKNPSTLPGICNCCWATIPESNPSIQLLLHQPTFIGFIEIIGRTDSINGEIILYHETQRLSGLHILIDGQNRDTYQHYDYTNNKVTVRMPPQRASNITINRPKTIEAWLLTICEIKVYPPVRNIAGSATVTASSTLIYGPYNYSAGNVIDGNNQTEPDNCDCCWASQNEPTPNIVLLLNTATPVVFIEIIGRTDQFVNEPRKLTDAHVITDGANRSRDQMMRGNNIYLSLSPLTPVQNITVVRPRPQGQTEWFLIICEIKVFSLGCQSNHYGDECTECGQCWDGTPCNNTTGVCTNGCEAGYIPPKCTAVCTSGTFGRNCSETCIPNCYASCNTVSGICIQGCKAGFMSTYCNTPCNQGTYGVNCTNICSDHCTGGYNNCDTGNGTCTSGCVPGYTGVNCDQDCPVTYYSVNCSQHCSSHCKQSHCDKITGTCNNGCVDGYLGQYCNEMCSAGTYGQNCTQTCGSCKNNISCNNTNGVCENGCEPGYNGTTCTLCPVGYYGDGCGKRCHCNHGLDCLKNNGSCPQACEFGWSGQSCSIDLNIISGVGLNTSVSQSSIFSDDPLSFGPHNAIDGIDNYDIDRCKCCSVTSQQPSWWQINLGQRYLIHALQIYGRSSGSDDQLQNAVIYAGNVSLALTQQDGVAIYTVPTMDATTRHFTEILDAAIIAQYFLVKLDRQILVLCEFKLFRQVCDVGRFGVGCSHMCHCYDNQTCNPVNGECQTPGCYHGWNGTSCDRACVSPAFGSNCRDTCHCINGTHCDHVTGHCGIGECDPYWQGESCNQECVSPAFGTKCNNTCHCINGTHCDHVTGHCDVGECEPGWQGESCNQECVTPAFGTKCYSICHCINGTHCDHVTGHCDLEECAPGWQGDSCNQVCASSTFGDHCSDTCHCASKSYCDYVTGICILGECDTGWQGDSCNKPYIKLATETVESNNTSLIVGGVLAAVLVLIAAVVLTVVYRRKKRSRPETQPETESNYFTDLIRPAGGNADNENSSHGNVNNTYEETRFNRKGDYYNVRPSIGIKQHQLWNYIHYNMQNDCAKFYEEFAKLPYGLVHQSKDAILTENVDDHSRVKLDITEEDEGDYINACFINGFDKLKKFVASEGPWKNMMNAFWRLVWQVNTDKIIMLTNLVEFEESKCLQYWPDKGKRYYGNVCVKLVKTETFHDYNVRHLRISKEGESARKIKQFHFKSWPDKDVPDSTWCLVNLWRVVDTNEVTGAGPLLVHGSAGVGRTGTFIALDNLMTQFKKEGCIRPLQTVQSLREQRVNMVQTKEQYVYLHEAVADVLLIGTRAIWTKQFQEVYMFMLHNENDATESAFEIQFNLIERGLDETIFDNDNVEYYNESSLVTKCDAHKPKLKKTGSVIAPQLGAVYMPNYSGDNTFILTQSPTKSTIEEFLTLIGEHNIKTVLMLTDESSSSYRESCHLQATVAGSRFTVTKIEEDISDNLIEQTISYKLRHGEGRKTTTIKQFRYPAWKDDHQVPDDTASFMEYFEAVLRWQPHLSESQPVLIHCGNGQNRSGLAYAVLNELLRIRAYSQVNIVDTVTKMKQRSRIMVAGYEQYRYCYDFILAYINHTQIYNNI